MTIAAFNTPDNERSFSGLVDRVLLETGLLGSLLSCVQYVNSTVRECQALGLFAQDLREEQEEATENPHIYTRPAQFRMLRTVKYDTQGIYPKFLMPGRNKDGLESAYFYAADNYFTFSGVLISENINMANYYWAKSLRYFGRLGVNTQAFPGGAYDKRPAYFDMDTNTWMYLNADENDYVDDLADDDEKELRQANASNWLIRDWYDLIVEGTKAKLYKAKGDQRSALSFALYKDMQAAFRLANGYEADPNVGQ